MAVDPSVAPRPRRATRPFYGWVVVAAVFCILALAYVIWYSFGLFLVALVQEFGWTRAEVAGAFSVFVLIHAVCSPLAGRLVDRFGSRALVHVGGLVVGLALIGCSQLSALWQLYLFFGLLTAVGVTAMGWVSAVALVGRWFSRRMGLAVGIIGAGIGLGTFIGAPPIQFLIETYGWRTAYVVLAVVLALAPQPLACCCATGPQRQARYRTAAGSRRRTPPRTAARMPSRPSPPAVVDRAPSARRRPPHCRRRRPPLPIPAWSIPSGSTRSGPSAAPCARGASSFCSSPSG